MEPKTREALIENITSALIRIHTDFKKDGLIQSLRTYDGQNILSYGYLRKLIEMGILINVGTSRKTARYSWNGGENPDYSALAVRIVDYQLTKSDSSESNKKLNLLAENAKIDAIISITIRLQKAGLTEDEIKKEIPQLLKAFSI
jgi:hypothetical protein